MALCLVLNVSCNNDNNTINNTAGISLQTFQNASVVIGQADFSGWDFNQGGTLDANTLNAPEGRLAAGSLYIPDTRNTRILGYYNTPVNNNAVANFVLGQPDFTSGSAGTDSASLWGPRDPWVFDNKLFIVDSGNHRVLIWNRLPRSYLPADVVLGQPDLTSRNFGAGAASLYEPASVAVAGNKVFVADKDNHRVLIWNSVPTTNGTPADIVLGQPDFASSSRLSSWLFLPKSVWSDGHRLIVADTGNCRVLIWNTIPGNNGTVADIVIGQADLTTRSCGTSARELFSPEGVYFNGEYLFIADTSNSRVLVYNAIPEVNYSAADIVLGQSNFTNRFPNDDNQDGIPEHFPTARTLDLPTGVYANKSQLFVTDTANHRILIFE